MKERLKNNIAILKQHNLTGRPVFHITDGHKYEMDLINEIVEDCEEIFNDEEQGLLVKLPCKVGDTVYLCIADDIFEWKVVSIEIFDFDTVLRLGHKGSLDYAAEYVSSLGKRLFTTRAEAEKKLSEIKRSN